LPNKTGVDVVSVTTAFLGSKVEFDNFVINKGNADDTFNVAIDLAHNNFPAGTTFSFFKADGATPLLDTNGDGKIDTGPLAPNTSAKVVVYATLPGTATSLVGPFDALMTATSVGNSGAFDSVWEHIGAIKSAKVDLTNSPAGNLVSTDGGQTTVACTAGSNCDLGQGPSSAPTFTTPTTPGTPAKFPIYITNQDTTADFDLTASVPPGWAVKFVADNGTNTSCADAAITSINVTGGTSAPSDPVGANEKKVFACVTPPAGTTPGTTNVQFTATKHGETVGDTITDAVNVSKPVNPSMVLGPNSGTNTVTNGGTVVQPVTLTNTGTTVCGGPSTNPTDVPKGFNVALSLDSAAQAAGWTALVYYDVNGDGVIDVLDKAIGATAVPNTTANLTHDIPVTSNALVPLKPAPANTAGIPLLVKTFAPSGAVIGSTATATLTVTDLNTVTPAENCPAQTAKYSTTVSNGQLRVLKSQVKDVACTATAIDPTTFGVAALLVNPGECIVYKVVATNEGNAAVSNVVLNDAVPAYTSYAATQLTTQCSATGVTGTPAAPSLVTSGTPIALTCGTVTLNPAGTITLFYKVKVQN
jgi:uncharacterized repeat protein (TIGR01451 family)